MTMREALTIDVSLINMYRNSPAFHTRTQVLEHKFESEKAYHEKLSMIIRLLAGRR